MDMRIHQVAMSSGHENSPGSIENIPYLFKNLSKSRLSDCFFGLFLVISEVKIAIFKISVFLVISIHSFTLFVLDIHNIGCLEPYLPLYGHFAIRRFFWESTCSIS